MENDMTQAYRASLLLVCLSLPVCASAQTSDAVIVGIVTDPSGASVSGAQVTAVNTATGISRDVVTNETGAYRIGPLVPGTYEVRISLPGFKTKVQSSVVLQTGGILKFDVTLEVGDVAERIEVVAAAPILKTQETSGGAVITTSQLQGI